MGTYSDNKLTQHDIDHMRETHEGLQEPCDSPDCQPEDGGWPECDCQNSAIIMTSLGYVEVWNDGTVTAYGVNWSIDDLAEAVADRIESEEGNAHPDDWEVLDVE